MKTKNEKPTRALPFGFSNENKFDPLIKSTESFLLPNAYNNS
jgi:hypothetical protein